MAYATNNGVRIHYDVEGDGPPLLLHHGFSASLESWRDSGYISQLKHKFQLILVDARGHGKSDKPQDPAAYGMQPRTGDVTAVLNDLNIERIHFMGYSMGGWVGFGMAIHEPDRLMSLTVGGNHAFGQELSIFRNLLQDGLEDWKAALEEMAGPMPEKSKERFFNNDAAALRAAVSNDRPDISQHISDVAIPTLIYAGDQDPIYSLSRQTTELFQNGAFFTVPGQNHIQTFYKRHLILSKAIPFWEEHQE